MREIIQKSLALVYKVVAMQKKVSFRPDTESTII